MIIKYKGKNYNIQTRSPTQVKDFCSKTGLKSFAETSGNRNVVFYNPKIYTIMQVSRDKQCLVYMGKYEKPEQPLNMSSMQKMFSDCQCKNLDLSDWDTSTVEDMSFVFAGKIRSVNISNFNYDSCKTMEGMFQNCSYLSDIDIEVPKTSHVFNAAAMFEGCNSLRKAKVSIKAETLEYIDFMFNDCKALLTCEVIDMNTSRVSNLNYMFANCVSLQKLSLEGWTSYRFSSMQYTFKNCTYLKYIDVTKFDDTAFERHSLKGYLDGCLLFVDAMNNIGNEGIRIIRNWVYKNSIYADCDLDNYINTVYKNYYNPTYKESLVSLQAKFNDKFELAVFLSKSLGDEKDGK